MNPSNQFAPPPLIDPFQLPDEDGYVWLKGNVHCHTTNSDGRVSPQARLDGYVRQGYDFLCLSDHFTITPVSSVTCPADFVLIQGAELHPDNPFGGQVHHFLALNLEQDIDSRKMPPQHVIDAVREQGGSVWLAHPYWSGVNILRDTLPLRGLAGIEVFNATCRAMARGESAVHWDDWLHLTDHLYPAIATDDSHGDEAEEWDTYQGWTMVRVKERTPAAIVAALAQGAAYGSSGPRIDQITLRPTVEPGRDEAVVEATLHSSPARRILAICDVYGNQYHEQGTLFERATFRLRPGARWVRFEVVGPDGSKAWSNPYDLTNLSERQERGSG